ncbi:AAA family ATPase [Sphingomonas jaspsi]|uniref:AAA family ATPase n=1 Tax=Sphingomonas jaspsi TaxID=392409 RepID=UPI000686B5E6|nr:hypothetical protein [Sphingomonas jaspsi]
MSVHNPERPNSQWMADTGPAPVRLLLAGVDGDANDLVGATAAGFPLDLVIVGAADPVDASMLQGAAAAVVQVDKENPASIARFETLAAGTLPLIAAAYDPPLALVRSLVRAGAHDVVPLPLVREELETALDPIRKLVAGMAQRTKAGHRKVVTVIKSEGGVGATSLISQLAIAFAASERALGREACLLDLDVQFGDAAFQLGLQPALCLTDMVEAGKRLDGDMLRSVAAQHPSGLSVVAAPKEITPLEALTSDQVLKIVDLAADEYGTVFVDLPMNWSNWSLSLLARSDLVLMVTELRVPCLHRARRQLDLLDAQGLHHLDVRIVVNRAEKGLFKQIGTADAERVLRRPVAYTIVNDHQTMTQAIDRGVPISEIKRKCALGKDIDQLEKGLAAALGLEH